MIKTKLVPGEWGVLKADKVLDAAEIESKARELLEQMSLEEKIQQMSGDIPFFPGAIDMMRSYNPEPIPAGENLRLGIPGIRFSDGPRGAVIYHSTCFPVSMARGASWDVALEERIGDAIGVEVRSQGANFFGGVCINLLRHPAWGRAQETYGEDPYHLGEMGAALVRGVQRHVMACIKHYACNSMENARFYVDVKVSQRTLREVYLPHFKRCVDEGAASVMSAYNQVNGEYCGHNTHLLRNILKGEWGFEGFIISDFVYGVRDARAAALAGLDIEMPFQQHYHKNLQRLVERGEVSEEVIDEAVLRILRTKIRFAQVGEPERYRAEVVVSDEHRNLAREAAVKSMVLLKNDPVKRGKPLLPLAPDQIECLAVIGRLADFANIGDHGSSMVRPPYVVTPLDGIEEALGDQCDLLYDNGQNLKRAAETAQDADVVILVVGYTHRDEGEYISYKRDGGDRDTLVLHRRDKDLIRAVVQANPNTIVVLVGGSAIVTEAWRKQVPAILMAWYPGMEGGNALADVLFGKANPSGRLPCVFPKSERQLPFFDKKAKTIEYGDLHGYRLMDARGDEPAFAFGYGLSYTTFSFANLRLTPERVEKDGMIQAQIEVANTGSMAGEEVVQLYVGCENSSVSRPVKILKGFKKVLLEPGETRQVTIDLPAQDLAYYDEARGEWVVEPVRYKISVGSSSCSDDLLHGHIEVSP
ncbi:MAG: glycoside hydrolase family 3 C-terminal domain-containing protein [Anaerolineales bacterium]|nr:glycoside hydrolase family 3 C-terminal domain-containing protein [Anaerolineales bacterium]